jgi:hypothetical protein
MEQELTLFNLTVTSLQEVGGQPEVVQRLKVMHSQSLRSLKGVDRFPALQFLNLSSNSIESMQGL